MFLPGNLLALALLFSAPPVVSVSPARVDVEAGASARGVVEITIPAGFHANANPPSQEYLVPVSIEAELPPGLRLSAIRYPAGREKTAAGGKKLRLYEGTIRIGYTMQVLSSVSPGRYRIPLRVEYQLCDETACFLPGEVAGEIEARVEEPLWIQVRVETGMVLEDEIRIDTFAIVAGERKETPLPAPPFHASTYFFEHYDGGGWALVFLFAFLGGVLLNLTPCVYPLIPITVGYFGAEKYGRSAPILYLLGITLTFAGLGLAAALGGYFFGGVLQSASLLFAVALFLLFLTGHSLGWYEITIPLPQSLATGAAGPFALGATAGLVAAPCIGPLVVGFLIFLSTRASPLMAFLALSAMGLGMGLPQMLLAYGIERFRGMPRPGSWMEWAKKAMGLLLPGAAIWILFPVLGPTRATALAAVWALVSGAYVGWFETSQGSNRFQWVRRGVGLAYAGLGIYFLLALSPPSAAPAGVVFEEFAFEKIGGGVPTIVDVRADWCLPCLELEQYTFSRPEVSRALAPFRRLRLDVTKRPPNDLAIWLAEREIRGVPTVLFFDGRGEEKMEIRLEGFESAEPFLRRVESMETR